MDGARPSQVGPYQLIRPLGAGGMAETFIAERKGPAGYTQQVCLKRILPGMARDATFVELFLDEARLLARMRCANIVQVYDFGQADDCYYMAIELVDGCDLGRLMENLRERGLEMPVPLALHIMGEVLAALSYAHELAVDGTPMGIVHRDISPANILVSKSGEVKLTDFGIAKAAGRSHRTQTGTVKGKIGYMSPEQIRGHALDGRSDLFSVGVVLFELLAGEHPFQGTTDFAVQLQIVGGQRTQLPGLRPDLAEVVVRLVDELLATDVDERPVSAAQALSMIPIAGSSFSMQQWLANLVTKPEEFGARRTAPTDLGVPPPAVSSAGARGAEKPPAEAIGTFGGRHQEVTAPQQRGRMGPPRYLVPAVLIAAVLGLALLGLWLKRSSASLRSVVELRLPTVETPSPVPVEAQPVAGGASDVTTAITPVNRARDVGKKPAVEEVVSPPKSAALRSERPVQRVVTPPKSDSEPARRDTESAVSPNAKPDEDVSVSDVISPRKTGAR